MIDVTDATIDTHLDRLGDKLGLVDVWATWCGPCKMYTPVLNQLSEETDITVLTVNADENPEIMQKHGIMSIPTVLVYLNGNVVDKLVGARPYAKLLQDLRRWQ